ncbi:MAG: hypothetical protein ABSG92_09100 [Conexivisphaerales archaeon]
MRPQFHNLYADDDVNALLFRSFRRHCIDRRHLVRDGGDSSYLIEFADYRLEALPPEATTPDRRNLT